jgi:hypothetical protein
LGIDRSRKRRRYESNQPTAAIPRCIPLISALQLEFIQNNDSPGHQKQKAEANMPPKRREKHENEKHRPNIQRIRAKASRSCHSLADGNVHPSCRA